MYETPEPDIMIKTYSAPVSMRKKYDNEALIDEYKIKNPKSGLITGYQHKITLGKTNLFRKDSI